MNNMRANKKDEVSGYQLDKFQDLIARLFQCCQERMQYQCERFQLPDAEFRCLGMFGEERYLTAKSIAHRMNVVKSRVSKIIDGLLKKGLIQRIKDPEDSRVHLLSLTPHMARCYPGWQPISAAPCLPILTFSRLPWRP